ncbi:MAG: NACHT domain-containing protein [Bacteroidia bacterium]|nr:NACHT domain-containing protein [Bacteroidia bacterium]
MVRINVSRTKIRFCLLFFIILSGSINGYCQTISKDSLFHLIEIRAKKDIQQGRSLKESIELKELYGEIADDVGISFLQVYEHYENTYTENKPVLSDWDKFLSKPWIFILISTLLVAFGKSLMVRIGNFFSKILEQLYIHFAGYRILRKIALKRYRRSLIKEYSDLKIPFRQGKPLDMADVYVPLKVVGSQNKEFTNAFQALGLDGRITVIGTPGSGKTMLMRHLALKYAREGLKSYKGQPIPILLELHRLSDPATDLETEIIETLARNDFPNAKSFLISGLKKGMFMFLFDGLDEVNQEIRDEVAQQLKDFIQIGPGCRVVVSCRSAVYHGEFADWNDRQLEIVEFDDKQIQNFLLAWKPEMPEGKSVDNLIQNIEERPRIMALARNPLMLTIVAYLYCDTTFILPHSRSEFYQRATDLLLDQWDQYKGNRNKFTTPQKKLVLQALAHFFQDRALNESKDRRSIPLESVLAKIKIILPSLNLPETHAQAILDEIVDRSGLLIKLDAGTRYQFTHLTLQEFFVAQDLKGKGDELIKKFNADPSAWREIVKLWCGLDQDCTKFIQKIIKDYPIVALECLGNAQQIQASVSEKLLNDYIDLLGTLRTDSDAIERGLSTVGADSRPRGKSLFKKLNEIIDGASTSIEKGNAAARVLSMTNLPQAAKVLSNSTKNNQRYRPYLVAMGNLSVPYLVEQAKNGQNWSVEALYKVGTVNSAINLVVLLWSEIDNIKFHAAWALGDLIRDSYVEESLREVVLTVPLDVEIFEWVWKPFQKSANDILGLIVGRVSFLIHSSTDEFTNSLEGSYNIDERLSIPLCIIASQGSKLKNLSDGEGKIVEEKLNIIVSEINPQILKINSREGFSMDSQLVDPQLIAKHIQPLANLFSDFKSWNRLFHCLRPGSQYELVKILSQSDIIPDEEDWKNVFYPTKYKFKKSFEYFGFLFTIFSAFGLMLWQIIGEAKNFYPFSDFSFAMMLCLLGSIGVVLMIYLILKSNLKGMDGSVSALGLLIVIPLVPFMNKQTFQFLDYNFDNYTILIINFIICLAIAVVYFSLESPPIHEFRNNFREFLIYFFPFVILSPLAWFVFDEFFSFELNISSIFCVTSFILFSSLIFYILQKDEDFNINLSSGEDTIIFLVIFLVLEFAGILPLYFLVKRIEELGVINILFFYILLVSVLCYLFIYSGLKKDRRARNPLQKLFHKNSIEKVERRKRFVLGLPYKWAKVVSEKLSN